LLTTTTIAGAIDHASGDLVATLPAGVSLAAANAALAREGQCLPLDPPFPELRTIGGIVATNACGPRRHHYGSPRDLIIGITVTLADGRAARAGGRVVKNVAGYDLSRLMCGSYGSLAVITSATFKLSPVSQHSRTVVAQLAGTSRLGAIVQALVSAPITPSTIEVAAPPLRLLIRFESTPSAAGLMASAAAEICKAHGAPSRTVTEDDERAEWEAALAAVWQERGTVAKISVLPTDVPHIVDEVGRGCETHGLSCNLAGRAALGVLYARLDGDAPAAASLLADVRHRASVGGGSVVVERAAPGLERFSRWGDAPAAMSIMRAVKARFDPNGILSPGMGPGGL
jgi:glycolate oxidase FAD binding subunit